MVCKNVLIKGRVQGVFFRVSIKDKADQLNVKGWVKNLPNGNVEAVFEGDADKVKKLVDYCGIGPSGAMIKSVEVNEFESEEKFDGFKIRY